MNTSDDMETVTSMPLPDDQASPSTAMDLDFPTGDADTDDSSSNEVTDEEMDQQKRRDCYKKSILALLLVGLIAYIIADSQTTMHIANAMEDFLEWIEENPISGFFAFIVVYFLATILWVPGSLLTLGAGFVFGSAFGVGPGVLLGTLSVFIGASLGSMAAFLMARYFLRDAIGKLSKKYATFQALDAAFEKKGLRIMVLLRLSPIIPFNAINYVAGVTTLQFWHFCIALLAILPGTALYVFLGASAGDLMDMMDGDSSKNSTVTIVVVVVGIVFGVAAVALTSYYAKKELNRITEEQNDDSDGEGRDESESNHTVDKDEEMGEATEESTSSQ
jgi:uncharacterized membrane protein YdjX (TVP38/TMEM64 family)